MTYTQQEKLAFNLSLDKTTVCGLPKQLLHSSEESFVTKLTEV